MEIEVGEYVRTKDGRVEKIKVINKYGIVHKHDSDNDTFDTGINWYAESGREINEEDIKTHSKNIIDLIEVGDIVNGCEVVAEKYTYIEMNFINVDSEISYGWETGAIPESEIKAMLTHEQYEQNSYKL